MNLYVILALSPQATDDEIRQAYRRLRSAAHPDKQGEASMFHAIQEAYEVLSDPARRAHYDQTGETSKPAEDRLQQVLVALVVGAIDQCPDVEHHDLLATIKRGVSQQLAAFANQQAALQQAIKKRERVLKRLARKDGEPTFILGVIRDNILENQQQIAKVDAEVAFHQALLAALDEFTYQVDMAPTTLGLDAYRTQAAMHGNHRSSFWDYPPRPFKP